MERIIAEGHSIGNHTQHHLNGWNNSNSVYIEDVHQASSLIASTLFRPPYGRIKRKQAKILELEGYKVIMWTILSADYDHSLNKEECASRVTSHIDNGNIYLFHDSDKGEERMLYALPMLLKQATAKGFLFKRIECVE
jgi:peptidoglycan/xylan/chitin deacetylase (PgdA/CDA1 family)